MSKNTALILSAFVILVVGGWFLLRPKQQSAQTPSTVSSTPAAETTTSTSTTLSTGATQEATPQTEQNLVSITASVFSPKNITIKAGETVAWTNSDSAVHTVDSAVHPTHQLYPPLNLGNIAPGDKKSLTFPTAGTYKYHDHLNPSLTGQVIVE